MKADKISSIAPTNSDFFLHTIKVLLKNITSIFLKKKKKLKQLDYYMFASHKIIRLMITYSPWLLHSNKDLLKKKLK